MPGQGEGVSRLRRREWLVTIAASSPAVASGLGLFETMLVRRGRIVHLEEHAARMIASAEALGFPAPDRDELRHCARSAARSNAPEGGIRVVWVASSSVWMLSADAIDVPAATLSRRERGRAVVLDHSIRRSLPQHKLTSYAVCTIALRDAVRAGADEALFADGDGHVLEGTATNVFAVAGERLVTAPVSAGLLPGIVRAWVLGAAVSEGLEIEERAPSVEELRGGALLTGSLTTVCALRELNGVPCAEPGAAVRRLIQRYAEETTIVAS